jgi:hypothetical protein
MDSSGFAKYALVLLLPLAYLARLYLRATPTPTPAPAVEAEEKPVKSIMQAPREDLLPPKDEPFTLAQLKAFDGSDPSKPIYVSIKGASPPPGSYFSEAECVYAWRRHSLRRVHESGRVRRRAVVQHLRGQGRLQGPRDVQSDGGECGPGL